VFVYELSHSGIYADHEDYDGRVYAGKSFVTGESTTNDLNGHGTHVTG